MEARFRKDFSSFDLLVGLAVTAMEELTPDNMEEREIGAIQGLVIAIGYLLDELPEDLTEPIVIDLSIYFERGKRYLRDLAFKEFTKTHIN